MVSQRSRRILLLFLLAVWVICSIPGIGIQASPNLKEKYPNLGKAMEIKKQFETILFIDMSKGTVVIVDDKLNPCKPVNPQKFEIFGNLYNEWKITPSSKVLDKIRHRLLGLFNSPVINEGNTIYLVWKNASPDILKLPFNMAFSNPIINTSYNSLPEAIKNLHHINEGLAKDKLKGNFRIVNALPQDETQYKKVGRPPGDWETEWKPEINKLNKFIENSWLKSKVFTSKPHETGIGKKEFENALENSKYMDIWVGHAASDRVGNPVLRLPNGDGFGRKEVKNLEQAPTILFLEVCNVKKEVKFFNRLIEDLAEKGNKMAVFSTNDVKLKVISLLIKNFKRQVDQLAKQNIRIEELISKVHQNVQQRMEKEKELVELPAMRMYTVSSEESSSTSLVIQLG